MITLNCFLQSSGSLETEVETSDLLLLPFIFPMERLRLIIKIIFIYWYRWVQEDIFFIVPLFSLRNYYSQLLFFELNYIESKYFNKKIKFFLRVI